MPNVMHADVNRCRCAARTETMTDHFCTKHVSVENCPHHAAGDAHSGDAIYSQCHLKNNALAKAVASTESKVCWQQLRVRVASVLLYAMDNCGHV